MSLRKLRESVKKNVAYNQEYKCAICKQMLPPSFQVDHIVPFCISYDNREENLQILCANCHACKTQNENYRINVFKKIKAEYQAYNTNLCWFCLETYNQHHEHICDKILKNIDSYDRSNIGSSHVNKMFHDLCYNYERMDVCDEEHINSNISEMMNENSDLAMEIEENVNTDTNTDTNINHSSLNIRITKDFIYCKHNAYKIHEEDLTVEYLADIIFKETRTKKDSKKYSQINIKFDLDPNYFNMDDATIEECYDDILAKLPDHLPERIIKDEFLIINVE